MSKFKQGDKAIITYSGVSSRIGQIVTIISPPIKTPNFYQGYKVKNKNCCVYEIDIINDIQPGRPTLYRETSLKPYYDGNERSSWSDCVWKPKEQCYS